jgi:hypothetical protein
VPVADGPGVLAFRPEDVTLMTPPSGKDAPIVHRVVDFGAHTVVDVVLSDGHRLKVQVKAADGLAPGQPIGFAAERLAFFRDGAVIHRSN